MRSSSAFLSPMDENMTLFNFPPREGNSKFSFILGDGSNYHDCCWGIIILSFEDAPPHQEGKARDLIVSGTMSPPRNGFPMSI
jgi:hypothetical protein